jgi:hypothetical protein
MPESVNSCLVACRPEVADAIALFAIGEMLFLGGFWDRAVEERLQGFLRFRTILGRRWNRIDKTRVGFHVREPGSVVGREDLHGFTRVCEHGTWFDGGLVVVKRQMETFRLGVTAAGRLENLDIPAQLVDLVFVVGIDVRNVVLVDETDHSLHNVIPVASLEENQRNVQLRELRFHEGEVLHDEIGPRWGCSVPAELCWAIKVHAQQGSFRLLRKLRSRVQCAIVMDAKILASKPMQHSCCQVWGCLLFKQGTQFLIRRLRRVNFFGALSAGMLLFRVIWCISLRHLCGLRTRCSGGLGLRAFSVKMYTSKKAVGNATCVLKENTRSRKRSG